MNDCNSCKYKYETNIASMECYTCENENNYEMVDYEKMFTTLKKLSEKLYKYEEAEEQGLIIKLPCKVGTKVYYLITTTNKSGFILPQEILYFEIYGNLYRAVCMNSRFTSSDINKTVFLTEAEALQALKERE